MKVLILEQEKTIRQSLSYFMERHKNFEVFLARSRKEGTSLFDRTRFDLVLCADRLPDGSGLEMLKEFVHRDPKIKSILMTAHGDELLKQEAFNAGIRGFLVKPFGLKQLEEAIERKNLVLSGDSTEAKSIR